jgi:hypothetical protein
VGEENMRNYGTFVYLAGSASAEFFADIALSPFEAIKVAVQTRPGFAKGLTDGAPKLIATEGFGSLFKSLVPLWGRQIPYTMMKFGAFENTVVALYKYAVPKPRDECTKGEQLGVSFAAGYIAGVFCAAVSHPADNLVSKLNAQKGATAGDIIKQARVREGMGARALGAKRGRARAGLAGGSVGRRRRPVSGAPFVGGRPFKFAIWTDGPRQTMRGRTHLHPPPRPDNTAPTIWPVQPPRRWPPAHRSHNTPLPTRHDPRPPPTRPRPTPCPNPRWAGGTSSPAACPCASSWSAPSPACSGASTTRSRCTAVSWGRGEGAAPAPQGVPL